MTLIEIIRIVLTACMALFIAYGAFLVLALMVATGVQQVQRLATTLRRKSAVARGSHSSAVDPTAPITVVRSERKWRR